MLVDATTVGTLTETGHIRKVCQVVRRSAWRPGRPGSHLSTREVPPYATLQACKGLARNSKLQQARFSHPLHARPVSLLYTNGQFGFCLHLPHLSSPLLVTLAPQLSGFLCTSGQHGPAQSFKKFSALLSVLRMPPPLLGQAHTHAPRCLLSLFFNWHWLSELRN